MSVVDSPAYANLTSAFLDKIFNPSTPNDPTVKYFSVAGRVDSVSIWHPFWFTKMVLDSFEEKHRAHLREKSQREESIESGLPLWAQPQEWGNDGLVTVQSAKWGEFLGIMEGCDHWEMRGARGIEFGVDLPGIPAIGLGNSLSGHWYPRAIDGWSLPDLTRLVGPWKKCEPDIEGNTRSTSNDDRGKRREREREKDDDIVKASTDKLSVVLDWLTDQVPSPSFNSKVTTEVRSRTMEILSALDKPISGEQKRKEQADPERRQNELKTRKDLERFYVALSRKLYDEGL